MLLIDSDGLFAGDRIAQLSDPAKLYWPWFFLASNGFGRLEINYRKLLSRAFCGFRQPPTEEQVMGFIREYANNLLFLYRAESGQVWGQWDCSAKHLPRYATAADRKSPRPPQEEFNRWKDAYISSKRTQVLSVSTFSEIYGKIPDLSEGLRTTPALTTPRKPLEIPQVSVPATISENSRKKVRAVAVAVAVADKHTEVIHTSGSSARQQQTASDLDFESPTPLPERAAYIEPPGADWIEFRQEAEQRSIMGSEAQWERAFNLHWRKAAVAARTRVFQSLSYRKLTCDNEPQYCTNPQKFFEERQWEKFDALPKRSQSKASKQAAEQGRAVLDELARRRAELAMESEPQVASGGR